mgnify:CR=1 FL=1
MATVPVTVQRRFVGLGRIGNRYLAVAATLLSAFVVVPVTAALFTDQAQYSAVLTSAWKSCSLADGQRTPVYLAGFETGR